jgi:trans-aconitate methyltransferase
VPALAEKGYRVQGIDLQPDLIARNRTRYPNIAFDCVPIQEFSPPEAFDLITTVTVINLPTVHCGFLFRKPG